ncbi:MAG: CPBP family intramembrane metalloprotease [Anaerolineae bacterium]|nr:CPBP family intramembrane metalloprotease [Anaerolineae bacterium]
MATAIRWTGVGFAHVGVMVGLAALADHSPDLAYSLALALPVPLLYALFRRRTPPTAPAPWWAGLAVWAFVVLSRAGAAALVAAGKAPFAIGPHLAIAGTGSLFALVALAILLGERSGGAAFGFTTQGALRQVLLGVGLALALQAIMRAPAWATGQLRVGAGGFAALAQSFPTELMTIALGEESLFRGYMQVSLQRRYPWWFATFLISMLFGLWHLPAALFAPSLLTLFGVVGFPFAFGLLAGVMFRLTGSILGPVVAHALYNAVNAMFA